MVNRVTLIGRLGADAEVRRLDNGTHVAKLKVATSESYKDKDNKWQELTEWHTVIAWRNLAERAEAHLKKGLLVYVDGKISTRKWKDKDGNERYSTEVVANAIRLLERNKDNNTSGYTPPAVSEPTQKSVPLVDDDFPNDEPEDDLPF